MHETFDKVDVLVDVPFEDAFEVFFEVFASDFDEDAEGLFTSDGHLGEVGADDGDVAVFKLLHGSAENEFKLLGDFGSAQFDLHVFSADSFAFVDDSYVHRDISE
jgi:hypothetical protein